MVYVSESLCTGCGECVDICPAGAIKVVNNRAQIDQDLCQACDACLAACLHGAILAIAELAPVKQPIVTRKRAPVSEPGLSWPGLWPALGAALVFIGQEIAPRAAWALLDAWDQRQASRNIVSSSWRAVTDADHTLRGGGLRRRWRGGQ